MSEEEELLARAAEERAAIVGRYRLGRQDGAPQVDAWEDPEFKIYQVTDRYGFIHDQEVLERSDPAAVRVELEREKKWVKMLRQWQAKPTSQPDKLRRRVFKGIPNALRGEAWSKMLNLATVKEEQGHTKYQEMRNLAWKWSTDIRQIDLDVNRTYRDHVFFRQRYNAKQQQLFNVLGAYSVYNVEIGYCQGMSQIAALLLMYLEEEDAFWALSRLVSDSKYSMHGFFIHGFPKLLRYQEHHDKIMNKFLPKLKKHLDRNGVDTGIYTLKWFFQCFLDRIPFKLTLRVWDVYLLEGERVLTAMAYNLLKLHRRNLMQLGMDDILQFLQVRLEKKFDFDEDHTIDSLQKCMDELKKAKLDYPGPAPQNELPRQPFGTFKEPAFEQKVGHRSSEFSNAERSTRDSVSMRRDAAMAAAAVASEEEEGRESPPTPITSTPPHPHPTTANGHATVPAQQRHSHGAAPGSKFSLDDASSLVGEGSRRSLDTSVTSTADLSVFSSATRSHAHEDAHSLDSQTGDEAGNSNGPSTPRASPDIVRIYVPYAPPTPTLTPSPGSGGGGRESGGGGRDSGGGGSYSGGGARENGDVSPKSPVDRNKIRILVMDQTNSLVSSDDGQTPIVEMLPPLVRNNFHHDQAIDLK
ncbi:USP6 N-terminal-like protein [Nilaparvata lugens]|uniref:USP6 N-terminal-like protein n=1 Tax=Nilaparvata lugens TaxID=108931 RepID=UPI00193D0D31|nr:USP6 N-terminal-like protein [Nilaparvata lugens]